ncbi:DUF2285 domain-containing protein [Bradyrhizobium aeschynomenes]|uniref:DUF2285 domain-containing protein n=1 Tax=Bradyrhizobium aeschynomenes TaxID=2734909 RepID=UPI0035D9D906
MPGNVSVAIRTIDETTAICLHKPKTPPPRLNSGSDGGFLFAADPTRRFDAQAIFWAPEVLPSVLRLAPTSQGRLAPFSHLDLRGSPDAELRRASDGWYAVLQLGGATHRLLLSRLPTKGTAVAVELPLDRDFDLQTRAAYRLWTALRRGPIRLPAQTGPIQQRLRMVLALRALDGRVEGENYRAIATVLFGSGRLTDRGWKTHDLRSRTIRLVQAGQGLVRGGYRNLLRSQRRSA